jgi:hypothetical protein
VLQYESITVINMEPLVLNQAVMRTVSHMLTQVTKDDLLLLSESVKP